MEIFEKVAQEVAVCMHSMEIIKTSVMEFVDGDKGLFDSFFSVLNSFNAVNGYSF